MSKGKPMKQLEGIEAVRKAKLNKYYENNKDKII